MRVDLRCYAIVDPEVSGGHELPGIAIEQALHRSGDAVEAVAVRHRGWHDPLARSELDPVGRISVHEDRDGDGVPDDLEPVLGLNPDNPDSNGDGIREMPGGGRPLKFRYAVRTEGDAGPPTAELISGWLRKIGIATTQKVYDDSRLTELIGKGDYDMFVWGWGVEPNPDFQLSVFTSFTAPNGTQGFFGDLL